jgi:hypothetical protein
VTLNYDNGLFKSVYLFRVFVLFAVVAAILFCAFRNWKLWFRNTVASGSLQSGVKI